MDKNKEWFEKRMEDVPRPELVGRANLSDEQLNKGKDDLLELIKQSQESVK